MENKTTLLIVGLIVIGVAVGAFVYTRDSGEGEMVQEVVQQEVNSEKKEARTLRDLLALGQSQKCTFENTVENSKSEGTVYFSGSRMRGDFVSLVEATGRSVVSHMITDGKEMRMWTDGESMGFLMNNMDREQSPDATVSNTSASGEAVDLDANLDYSCESWVADASFFVPPANIMFHSMEDMMMHAPGASMPMGGGSDAGMGVGMEAGGSPDLKTMQCAVCDQAPTAEAKAQCRASLGCN